jgi:hypothetical protein
MCIANVKGEPVTDRAQPRKVYELAKDLAEAKGLRDAGFGFETLKAAKEAKAEVNKTADPFYANMLKIFKLEEL